MAVSKFGQSGNASLDTTATSIKRQIRQLYALFLIKVHWAVFDFLNQLNHTLGKIIMCCLQDNMSLYGVRQIVGTNHNSNPRSDNYTHNNPSFPRQHVEWPRWNTAGGAWFSVLMYWCCQKLFITKVNCYFFAMLSFHADFSRRWGSTSFIKVDNSPDAKRQQM